MTTSRRFRSRGHAEPSIPLGVRVAVAVLGAKRIITPPLRRRLELTGLTWDEMAPILARIRSIDGWARTWRTEAEASAARGDFHHAAAKAFLAHLPLSPFHPQKASLLAHLREWHVRDRAARPGSTFERVVLADGKLVGYWEKPESNRAALPVVLMPPLASTKEEMTVLGDALLDAGHPVLRLDLPGQGESPPPLTVDAEKRLARGLDELGIDACFTGGISLGAYFALRLAGADRRRVRGVFGVSPPAIITPEQWDKQEPVIYQYLGIYFGTESRATTRSIGLSMTLDDVIADVSCPVRLYHATRDTISLPDAAERYRTALSHAPLSDVLLDDLHGCALNLKSVIAPGIVQWMDDVASVRA